MTETIWFATSLVVLGGVMLGGFALPIKYTRLWTWENIWLVYSVVGLAIVPWVAATATVPDLLSVYKSVASRTLAMVALFGFGWGVGNVLLGVAVPLVGVALSFAVVVGTSASFGSLIPLLVQHPERAFEPSGLLVIVGVALTLGGVALLGAAGVRRERAGWQATKSAPSGSVKVGLVLCVASGVMGSMLNFSFVFGSPITDQAIAHGATKLEAANAIWAISLSGGLLSNGGYSILKLFRNRSWKKFTVQGVSHYWLLGTLMGVLFTGGMLLYGAGASGMGVVGAVIGWPAFQASILAASTSLGAATGEWRGADSAFLRFTGAGLAALLSAVIALSFAGRM